MTASFAAPVGRKGAPGEQAVTGVPIFAVLLTGYLAGFLARTARRAATTVRSSATGIGAALGAAVGWPLERRAE